MKKNILKKVVASLATAAMAVGVLATAPADEVKAADKETEIVLVLSGETTADKILLDFDNQDAGVTASGTVDTSVGWGRDMYTFTKDSNDATVYTITTTGDVPDGKYCNMQFLLVTGTDVKGYKYYPQDGRDIFNNNDKIYIQIDLSADNWTVVKASAEDPKAAKPADIMAVIDEIGTVELTDDCLNRIKAAEAAYNTFTGDKSAVTNYDKLVAAREQFDSMVAAGAGTLTVYVKSPSWTEMCIYGFDGSNFGDWPGTALTPMKNNEGWYSCSFEINKVANIIFNNNNNGEQTIDWKYVSAGTYWVTLGEKGDDGKYLVNSSNVSTTAPAGWKTEEAEKVENETTTQAPTTQNSNTSTGTNTGSDSSAPQTNDVASVVMMIAVASIAAVAVLSMRKKTVEQ